MKRPYSLDFSLAHDTERLKAVEAIISTGVTLSPKDIEQLADYVLYGVKEGSSRNNFAGGSMVSPATSGRPGHVSLDELMENPNGFDHTRLAPLGPARYTTKTRPVTRPHVDENGARLDDGDEDVPGMRELWDSIDKVVKRLKELEGKTDETNSSDEMNNEERGWVASFAGAPAADAFLASDVLTDGSTDTLASDSTARTNLAAPNFHSNFEVCEDGSAATIDSLDKSMWSFNEGDNDLDFVFNGTQSQSVNYPYLIHRLKHALKELRQDQYLLRDAYHPTLHFQRPNSSLGSGPNSPSVNFDQDSAYWIKADELQTRLKDYREPALGRNFKAYDCVEDPDTGEIMARWVVREQEFDWENPLHIKALLNLYSAIWEQNYEKPLSWGQTLIYDFNRYFDLSHFTPIQEYVVTLHVDGLSAEAIVQEILKNPQFGFKYSKNQIYNIIKKQVPNGMAMTAKKIRLIHDTPDFMKKKCRKCGRMLPKNTVFFSVNMSRPDHFNSRCKECERAMRIGAYDKRFKRKDPQAVLANGTDFGNILDTPRKKATEE